MREFKFRAYEKDSDEMFYPDTTNNNEYFFSGFIDGVLKVATSPYSDDKDYILMQYTGLIDKNGKEIYEGDIVTRTINDKYYLTGKVVMDEGATMIVRGEESMFLTTNFRGHKNEVIGNIYETPELL